MALPQLKKASDIVQCAFDGSIAVEVGDLMFHDSDDVKPASSMTDQGTTAQNLKLFAELFAGVAAETRLTADGAVTLFPVYREVDAIFDCISATFEVGDLLAVDEASGGTSLENTVLIKTTDPASAIGKCTRRESSATTRVHCRLTARTTNNDFSKGRFLFDGAEVNSETLAAAKTLVQSDAPIQVLDPGGAGRDVNLPAESLKLAFIIHNSADAAEVLTIKDDGGGTICTPTQNESAIVYSDGTTYRGIVGESN